MVVYKTNTICEKLVLKKDKSQVLYITDYVKPIITFLWLT